MAKFNKVNTFAGDAYALEKDLKKYITGSTAAAFDASTGKVTLKTGEGEDYVIDLSTLVKAASDGGMTVTSNSIAINVDGETIEITAATGTNGKLRVSQAVINRLAAVEAKFGTFIANRVVTVNAAGSAIEASGISTDAVVTMGDASAAAGRIIVAAGADKTVKDSGKAFLEQGEAATSKITDASTDAEVPTAKAVRTAIKEISSEVIGIAAGDGIRISVSGTTNTIAQALRLCKLETATEGYAASYKLQYLAEAVGTEARVWTDAGDQSATIDVMKDKFLKSAEFGWANTKDVSSSSFSWQVVKDTTHIYPMIKFEVYTAETPTSEVATSAFYVDCEGLFHDYVGTGSISVDAATNVISLHGGWNQANYIVTTKSNGDIQNSEKAFMVQGTETIPVIISTSTDAAIPSAKAVYTLNKAEVDAASTAEQTLYGNDTALNDAIGAIMNLAEADVAFNATAKVGIWTVVDDGNGKITMTSDAGAVAGAHRIIAVYDNSGNQVMPDVTYNKATKIAKLVADYGSAAAKTASGDTQFTIVYTVASTKATLTQPIDR